MFEDLYFCGSVALGVEYFTASVWSCICSCFNDSSLDCWGSSIVIRWQDAWFYFRGCSIYYDWLPSRTEHVHALVSSVYKHSIIVELSHAGHSSKIGAWFPVEFLDEAFSYRSKVMAKLVLQQHCRWSASQVFGISKWFVNWVKSHSF